MNGIRIFKELPRDDPVANGKDPGDVPYGEISVKRLLEIFPAWVESRDRYTPHQEFVEKLKGTAPVAIRIFFGAWCPDCGVMVPRFLKILDAAGLTGRLDVSLCALDRLKRFPEGLVNRYGIKFVPTFVFERVGKEIGRIVETPSSPSLEEDMWKILGE